MLYFIDRRISFYFERAFKKAERGDDSGAIVDYTKVIELDSEYVDWILSSIISTGSKWEITW